MNKEIDLQIRFIPVKNINILNPRDRAKKKFAQITANIGKLGLKRPITVAHAGGKNGASMYNLVCGQGRLEAYINLGQEVIPAIVVEGTKEDLLLMSLTENIARRSHSTLELVKEIGALKDRGHSVTAIANKTDLSSEYVKALLQLLARGEEKLLQAVDKGQIPVNIAVTIATTDDKDMQRALTDAYEKNALRGQALLKARQLIENRRARGKRIHPGKRVASPRPVSSDELVKTYQKDRVRQKLVIQRAKICETRLLFAISALKQLFRDEHFVTLLRAESLDVLPDILATRILG